MLDSVLDITNLDNILLLLGYKEANEFEIAVRNNLHNENFEPCFKIKELE